jgi:hypothetical protein
MRHFGGSEEYPALMIAIAVIMMSSQQSRLRLAATLW